MINAKSRPTPEDIRMPETKKDEVILYSHGTKLLRISLEGKPECVDRFVNMVRERQKLLRQEHGQGDCGSIQ